MRTLMLLIVAATSSLALATTTPTNTYSAYALVPDQVYVPAGQTLAFSAPTFIISITK